MREAADGGVAPGLVGYPLADRPEPIDEDEVPAMFVPLLQLEGLVSGGPYVNVLATCPAHRGRGCGAQLIGVA